jgi:hypothetical protein
MHPRTLLRAPALLIATALIVSACSQPSQSQSASQPQGSASESASADVPLYGGTVVYADFTDFPTCNPATTSLPRH